MQAVCRAGVQAYRQTWRVRANNKHEGIQATQGTHLPRHIRLHQGLASGERRGGDGRNAHSHELELIPRRHRCTQVSSGPPTTRASQTKPEDTPGLSARSHLHTSSQQLQGVPSVCSTHHVQRVCRRALVQSRGVHDHDGVPVPRQGALHALGGQGSGLRIPQMQHPSHSLWLWTTCTSLRRTPWCGCPGRRTPPCMRYVHDAARTSPLPFSPCPRTHSARARHTGSTVTPHAHTLEE